MKIKKAYLCHESVGIVDKDNERPFILPKDVYSVHLCFKTKKAMFKMFGKGCKFTECKVKI